MQPVLLQCSALAAVNPPSFTQAMQENPREKPPSSGLCGVPITVIIGLKIFGISRREIAFFRLLFLGLLCLVAPMRVLSARFF